ncbi:MAG TPA: glycoside hydrolase family 30 beta sandwich domain-containing protein, partial [Thermomicrobiales bacterium]|nr:glycoside hydrolase family 30 beta sandwich domain-containing protein [Thermomicrobiales bacterium]
VPRWMCAENGQMLIDLEGYAELATSLAHWAREKEHIEFTLFGPFNETDLGPPEGPLLAPAPLAEVSVRIAERLAALGMGDVGLVLADEAHYGLYYMQELVRHRAVRDRLAVVGMHSYRDQDLSGVPAFLREHDLTSCRYWLTEYGDLDQTGELEWTVALNSTRRLLRGLNDGVQGAMVWDAYDNWHDHDRAWSIYGLLRTAHGSYTPKKRYFAGKHISRYVPVTSVRVHTACSDPSLAVAAFRTQSEEVTLVVLNESGTARRLNVELDERFVGRTCRVYASDPERNCDQTMMFPLAARVQIPLTATSITTFTSVA